MGIHDEEESLENNVQNNKKIIFFALLGMAFLILSFVFNRPAEILYGSIKILTSPANLITDYIALSNTGATLFNVGILTLVSLAMVVISGARINGPIAAAILTVSGFAFFGKNLYNSLPITLGVYLYARMDRVPFKQYLLAALYSSSLGPLVSEMSFAIGVPHYWGILLGIIVGISVGLVVQPLAAQFIKFHQGYSLYNIGFTAGIIGMFYMAVLRGMGIEVLPVSILSSGNNIKFMFILFTIFFIMLLCGLYENQWSFRGYWRLLLHPGKHGTDYLKTSGTGPTLINMALLGFLMTLYVLVVGGELNGPTIGGILTVTGFGAAGKHIRNVLPIITGVLIAKMVNIYEPASTAAILAALFGTTLAPVAGQYGVIAGILAGALHMAVTMNITYLHGGVNLYNNGFSGGFIAAALVPLIDAFIRVWNKRSTKTHL